MEAAARETDETPRMCGVGVVGWGQGGAGPSLTVMNASTVIRDDTTWATEASSSRMLGHQALSHVPNHVQETGVRPMPSQAPTVPGFLYA